MRTNILLTTAVLLLASIHGAARLLLLSGALATIVFLFLWLARSKLNMWFDAVEARYSLAEEWPIFMALFGVPAICAVLLKWRLSNSL